MQTTFKDFMENLKNKALETAERMSEKSGSSITKTIILMIVMWWFSLIPFWISCIIFSLSNPETFWQGFAIGACLLIVFGIPQFILAVMAGMASTMIILDKIEDSSFNETVKKYTFKESKPKTEDGKTDF